jgi:hypothetical protein
LHLTITHYSCIQARQAIAGESCMPGCRGSSWEHQQSSNAGWKKTAPRAAQKGYELRCIAVMFACKGANIVHLLACTLHQVACIVCCIGHAMHIRMDPYNKQRRKADRPVLKARAHQSTSSATHKAPQGASQGWHCSSGCWPQLRNGCLTNGNAQTQKGPQAEALHPLAILRIESGTHTYMCTPAPSPAARKKGPGPIHAHVRLSYHTSCDAWALKNGWPA